MAFLPSNRRFGAIRPPGQPAVPGVPLNQPTPVPEPSPNIPIEGGGQMGLPNSTAPAPQPGTSFGPGNNLIGQQLLPQTSPDTAQARGYIGQNLGALQQMPDRQALAGQTYDQLAQQSAPQFAQDLQGVGRKAAALGRIGAGMTTSELGDVQSNREKYLGNLRAQLSTNAAGLAQQDQLGRLGASQGVYGQLGGADQLAYGNLTGERGYQQGLSQQAFQNNLAQTDQAAQYGMQGPNTLSYLLSQQYANQGQESQQNSGDLLKLLFQNQQPKPAATAPNPYAGIGY